ARGKPAAEVIVAGKRCPIAGRVSMDLLAVDVSDLAEGAARRGDLATLIGGGISMDGRSAGMGPMGYEVLTNLGRRSHRFYRGECFGASVVGAAPCRCAFLVFAALHPGHPRSEPYRSHGPPRNDLHLPELRRRLRPL